MTATPVVTALVVCAAAILDGPAQAVIIVVARMTALDVACATMVNANASRVTEIWTAHPLGVLAIAPTTECAILACAFVTLVSLATPVNWNLVPTCALATVSVMAYRVSATVDGKARIVP